MNGFGTDGDLKLGVGANGDALAFKLWFAGVEPKATVGAVVGAVAPPKLLMGVVCAPKVPPPNAGVEAITEVVPPKGLEATA